MDLEKIQRIMDMLQRLSGKIRSLQRVYEDIDKTVGAIRWLSVKVKAQADRSYVLYREGGENEEGEIRLRIADGEIKVYADVSWSKAMNFLRKYGVQRDMLTMEIRLAEILFLLEHLDEALKGMEELIPKLEAEREAAERLFEMLKEVLALLTLQKI